MSIEDSIRIEKLLRVNTILLALFIVAAFALNGVSLAYTAVSLRVRPADVLTEVEDLGKHVDGQISSVRAVLDERGPVIGTLLKYVETATADRWTRIDDQRWRESFFNANPNLVKPEPINE